MLLWCILGNCAFVFWSIYFEPSLDDWLWCEVFGNTCSYSLEAVIFFVKLLQRLLDALQNRLFLLFSSFLSYSLSPLGAEVCPGGQSVSAPSEVACALGHRRDLPHTPWEVRVCVSLPASSLRHSDWNRNLELLDEFFFNQFCNRLHIISTTQTHTQQRRRQQLHWHTAVRFTNSDM